MNRVARGAVSIATGLTAGLAYVGAAEVLGNPPEISQAVIERCAGGLGEVATYAREIPDNCKAVARYFDEGASEEVDVVNSYNGQHEKGYDYKFRVYSRQEFHNKVDAFDQNDHNRQIYVILAGAAIATATGVGIYLWRKKEDEQIVMEGAYLQTDDVATLAVGDSELHDRYIEEMLA